MVTTLRISGMTCNGCVRHVREALRGVPGVSAVDVSLAQAYAQVEYDPAKTSLDDLVGVVKLAGYTAAPVTSGGAGA